MSWSVATKVVKKSEIESAVYYLELDPELNSPASQDQLEAAKRGAIEVLKGIPGPYISVNLSGHANGVGWHKADGWSNDFVSIGVSQHTQEDYERFYKNV